MPARSDVVECFKAGRAALLRIQRRGELETLSCALSAWQEHARRGRRLRALVLRSVMSLSGRRMRVVLEAWRREAESSAEGRRAGMRAVAFASRRVYRKTWAAWGEAVRAAREEEFDEWWMEARASRWYTRGRLARCLAALRGEAEGARAREEAAGAMLERRMEATCRDVLRGWLVRKLARLLAFPPALSSCVRNTTPEPPTLNPAPSAGRSLAGRGGREAGLPERYGIRGPPRGITAPARRLPRLGGLGGRGCGGGRAG